MVVKVYGPVTAGCPQRVMACLLEKDVEFEIIHVNIDNGEHKRPEFLLRQPFGQVPVIEDDDFRLFESRAILRYYAAKYADRGPNLLGTTLEERATVDQWLEVEAHNFNDLIYTMVLQLIVLPSMGQPGDLTLVHTCEQKLETVFDVYEKQLLKSKYLAGDWFFLADLSPMPALRFLTEDVKLVPLGKERKHVNGGGEEISGPPSWKKLMKLAYY
uniref:glutathione transferase n=1 Tax=Litchi chinensis TaxID=151069 RepID=A6N6L0_LITCN|nr:glutathione S-transferase [Litchi chinensis]